MIENLDGQANFALMQMNHSKDLGVNAKDNKAAWEAAKNFESIFVQQMLEHMWSGIKTDGPFGGGQGEAMFRSLRNEEYAKQLTGQGGIGIAENIYQEILKMQEITVNDPAEGAR